MRPYFEKMPDFGRVLSEGQKKSNKDNVTQIKEVENQVKAEVEKVKNAGMPTEKINERGEMTIWQRLAYLVDPGTWCPLHTIFNPTNNPEGTTNVIDGLGKISGKWAVIIGFDNKVMAGAWLPGQAENVLASHGSCQKASYSPCLACKLQRSQIARSGKVLWKPPGIGNNIFQACRA